jgi:endonuclease/exonuclease/phosphatase family metal-dependent hydrolase
MYLQTKKKNKFFQVTDTKVEHENFATVSEATNDKNKLVVASYNIRYAVGSFLISGGLLRRVGISRPSRRTELVSTNIENAARVVTNSKHFPMPDILALQEADKETIRAGGVHIARELAKQMNWNYAHTSLGLPREYKPSNKQWYLDFEESISQDDSGETGLAFLSRHKLNDLMRLDLPWFDCPWRPRIALATTLEFGDKKIRVFNAHIDPHASVKEQHEQHEIILAQAEKDNLPTILLGDFNTLTPNARKKTRKFFDERGYKTPFKRFTSTWRAGLYRNHTDWIYTRGLNCLHYGVLKSLRISDHWLIWAEIDLR